MQMYTVQWGWKPKSHQAPGPGAKTQVADELTSAAAAHSAPKQGSQQREDGGARLGSPRAGPRPPALCQTLACHRRPPRPESGPCTQAFFMARPDVCSTWRSMQRRGGGGSPRTLSPEWGVPGTQARGAIRARKSRVAATNTRAAGVCKNFLPGALGAQERGRRRA